MSHKKKVAARKCAATYDQLYKEICDSPVRYVDI